MEKLYVVKAENAGNLMINITFSDNTTKRLMSAILSVVIHIRNTTNILTPVSSVVLR